MIDDLLAAARETDGWVRLALWRLGRDPLADRIPAPARRPVLEAARAIGAETAERALQRGWSSAEAAVRDLGVRLRESDQDGAWDGLVQHALYTTPPPTVTLYREPVDALQRLVAAEKILGDVDVRDLVLTHELFHHLVALEGARPELRPRVEVLRLGRWRRTAVVRAAEEIGAAGFTERWHRLPWPPELLDCLTLVACGRPAELSLPELA